MLGDKMRDVRKRRGLTLTQLAEESDLTASYISQVERNLIDPSITALKRIAAALHTPLYTFLDDNAGQTMLIRATERRRLALPNSHVTYEYLTPTASNDAEMPKMEVIMLRLKSKRWSRDTHACHAVAEETITLLSGALLVDCVEQQYEMLPGDSLYVRSTRPHNIYNPGDEEAVVMLCLTPPAL